MGAMKDEDLWKEASMYNIMFEGYVTYGGMSGRDMSALAIGLDEGTEFNYLESRTKQIEYLGEKLDEYGIPYQKPAGGNAMYLEAGIRGVEVGTILADRDPETRENRYPELELFRLAIPRRTYTKNHIDYIAVALRNVYNRRNQIKHGFKFVHEASIMRHFTVKLERSVPLEELERNDSFRSAVRRLSWGS